MLAVALDDFPAAYPLVLFLADTGCRLGEGIGVWWSDLDLASGTARIERSVDHLGRVGRTKTRRIRTVELTSRLRLLLAERAHLDRRGCTGLRERGGQLHRPGELPKPGVRACGAPGARAGTSPDAARPAAHVGVAAPRGGDADQVDPGTRRVDEGEAATRRVRPLPADRDPGLRGRPYAPKRTPGTPSRSRPDGVEAHRAR